MKMRWVTGPMRWAWLWVLILFPRLLILISQPLFTEPHGEVERSAACLAHNGFLGDPFPGYGLPSAHVAPLYPTVLAGMYVVFGDGWAGHLAQSLFAIAITEIGICLLPRLAQVVFGSSASGWAAAILMSVLPYNMSFIQVHGNWEQHCSFLAVGLYLPMLLAVHRDSWHSVRLPVYAGLMTGVCVLLNPQFAIVFVLFLVYEGLIWSNRLVARRMGLAVCLATLVVAPWIVRNYVLLGGFCMVRSNPGLELAIGNHETANGKTFTTYWDDPTNPMETLHPYTSSDQVKALKEEGELAYMRRHQQDALNWIQDHPVRWIELTMTRIFLFWFPPASMWSPSSGTESARWIRSLGYSGVTVLMVCGLVMLFYSDRAAFGIVMATLIGLSASYYVTHVDVRYIFPIHGIALVLAGKSLVSAVTIVRRS
jgi:hypothetical protein